MTDDDTTADHDVLTEVEQLVQLVGSGAMSQAIAVAAELGIADLLADGPKSATELASATGCHAPALRRLLRALVSVDVCIECEDGLFALAATGTLLRSDADNALRAYTIWWGRYRWPVWGNLLHSIKTGERAGGPLSGTVGMKELNQDPQAASIFHSAMAELTRVVATGVVRSYDFSRIKRIVDVGGGHGELLAAILVANPAMRGVLFDQSHAIDGAREHFERTGVIERCEIVSGDFFESVPDNGDAYLLKSIIHDWDDEHSTVILRNCRKAMGVQGKLLLVEQIMPQRMAAFGHQNAAVRDLNMLVMLGGQERTAVEFRDLLHGAGFTLTRTAGIALDFSVIDAVAA